MKGNPAILPELGDPGRYISTVAVKVDPALSPKETGNSILQAHAVEYNLDLVVAESVVSDTARRLHTLSSAVYRVAA